MKYLSKYLFIFLLLITSNLTISQKVSKDLSRHIEQKLHSVDSLLTIKDFNLALSKINDLESYSNYTKTSQSKNESGNTTYYLLNLKVVFEIKSENKKNDLNIEEKFVMKNYSNEYDENNYEKSVQKNMTNLIVEKLILQLSRM